MTFFKSFHRDNVSTNKRFYFNDISVCSLVTKYLTSSSHINMGTSMLTDAVSTDEFKGTE